MATLNSLEQWLVAITQHTYATKEALLNRGGGASPAGPLARIDTSIDKLGRRLEGVLASQAATRLAQVQGLANRGMAGTAEQARLDFAMDQLGRQFAAVMLPVVQAMTYGADQIERRMRGMSGSEQNRMLGGLLGAGIGLRYGGLPGALAGGALGMLAMTDFRGGDPPTSDRVMGAATGAYAGFRVGGPWGAAVGAGAGVIGTSGDYARFRQAGKSRLASAVMTFGAGVYEAPHALFGSGDAPLDEGRRRWDAKQAAKRAGAGGGDARRDVTPFQATMDEAGGFAARAQELMTRVTAGAPDDGGPFKPLIDIGLAILDRLAVLINLGGGAVPPPRSGAEGGAGM